MPLAFALPSGWYLLRTKSQSSYCTRWKGLVDLRVQLRRDQTARRIAAEMRPVAEDKSLSLVEWDSPAGRYWVPAGPALLLAELLAQQQGDVYGDEQAGVHSHDVVIDCGAHVGVFVRKSLARGARIVVAVEPAPHAAQCLRRNFAEEIRNGSVVVCEKAIWRVPGETMKFFLNGNSDAADSLMWQTKSAASVDVPTTTIDAIAADYHLDRIDFIKADIKGAASAMLEGARESLLRWHPRLAISTEEGFDHPAELAAQVNGIAPNSYRAVCGPCITSAGSIFTDVLFFR